MGVGVNDEMVIRQVLNNCMTNLCMQMDVFAYDEGELRLFIGETAMSLKNVGCAEEAVLILHAALKRYTIFDLQKIGGRVRAEVEKLPDSYKRKYKPYANDLLNRYHEFMSLVRSGMSADMITDVELWKKFWEGAVEGCFSERVSENDPRPEFSNPAGKFFYRLVYGYTMLIAGKPGHPVGMPFPGGWSVYEKDGVIVCPIRDKEKDLPQALCNFCPAVQDGDCI